MSLATRLLDLSTRLATEMKSLRTLINGNAANLNALTTTDKTTLVAAINEVKAGSAGSPPASSETVAGVIELATQAEVNAGTDPGRAVTPVTLAAVRAALKAEILGAAGAAYDTLEELKTYVDSLDSADETQIQGVLTALGYRVRFDAAQTLTGGEKTQALTNIGAAAASHTHAAAQISDSTAVGRSVVTAVDAAAARTAIGAGTSNLAIGGTAVTAAAGDHTHTPASIGAAAASHTHTAAQISDSTTVGRGVVTAADAPAARTAIGAGTSNLAIGTTVGTAADASTIGDTNTDFVATFNAGLV